MGVEHLWIVDPIDRSAATYTRAGMKAVEGTRLEIAGTWIWLDVGDVCVVGWAVGYVGDRFSN